VSFGYASDGCLTTKSDGADTWTYDWDFERRLEAFKENSATLVEYTYNPTGTRRQASDSTLGVENYFHHRSRMLGDYNSNWGLETSYILGANAMVDRTTDPTTAYYSTQDRLRSTRELVNSAENAVTRYDYDVWSNTTESHLMGSLSTRYRAGGLECLAGDLYAKTKRMYDPSVGRDVQANFNQTMLFPDGGRYDGPGPLLGVPTQDVRPCCGLPLPPCTEGAVGYCEMWLEDCQASCQSRECLHKYHKALCYRCCQCYYKRCWADGCGDKWKKMDPKPMFLYGPPDRCTSGMSPLVCGAACYGVDYNPPGPPEEDQPCDDEGRSHTWENICCSSSGVFGQYGDSQPLALVSPGPIQVGKCHLCGYRDVYFGGSRRAWAVIRINASERCPSYLPKNIGGYGFNIYWRDWAYLNSCSYKPWVPKMPPSPPIGPR